MVGMFTGMARLSSTNQTQLPMFIRMPQGHLDVERLTQPWDGFSYSDWTTIDIAVKEFLPVVVILC